MDFALILLTAALAVTTAIYAYFTWRMASEMRTTRLLSVRPRLALDINMISPMGGMIRVRNLGPGSALDVSLRLFCDPPSANWGRPWQASVLVPGQGASFYASKPADNADPFSLPALADFGVKVWITGSMKDVDGNEHGIADTFDVADWWKAISEADQNFREEEPVIRNRELKKLREATEKIAPAMKSLAADVHRLVQGEPRPPASLG